MLSDSANLRCNGGGSISTNTVEGHSHTFTISDATGGNGVYFKNFLKAELVGCSWISNVVNGHYHTITISTMPTTGGQAPELVRVSSNTLTVSGGGTLYTDFASSDHTHTTPAHTHALSFGIYEETNTPSIYYYIDNGTGYGSAYGPYTSDQTDLDITSLISGAGWKRIKFTTNQRCRIAAIIECKLDIAA